MRSSIS